MQREMIHMTNLRFQRLSCRARRAMVPLAIAVVWAASSARPVNAEPSDQQTFASAMEASKVFFEAVRANDGELIVKILGGPTELASSGDKNQDKLDRECFVQHYQEMHRMVREDDGKVILYIGAENWPFPIPLLEKDGVWRFDPDAGMQEVLYRRIGENELTAIATCHEFADQNRDSGKPQRSGGRLCGRPYLESRRQSCSIPRLLFSRINNASNQWSSPGKEE